MVSDNESIVVPENLVSVFLIDRGGVTTSKLVNMDKVSRWIHHSLNHCKVLELLPELWQNCK